MTRTGSHTAVRRRWTVIAAGLLILALALVVIYTGPAAFLSPIALVVVAAIGLAALLFQIRFRQDLPEIRSPWGLIFLDCSLQPGHCWRTTSTWRAPYSNWSPSARSSALASADRLFSMRCAGMHARSNW